ncbi:unnamed protein product, partial [Gongylonema pulchrum]|uniref:Protein muscleblind n=1 Tax=Gongylonema pulchrum TaxID=637853 RepID=A0A183ELH2_9BILA
MMDEGDDYVPQISQLDYSLMAGGPAALQADAAGIYGQPSPQMPLQHIQYGGEPAPIHPCQMPNPLAPQMMHQPQQVMPPAAPQMQPSVVPRPKVPRRRKNATNVEQQQQQQQQQQQTPAAQAMLPPSPVPRHQYMGAMSPMQSMAAMSQNPLMAHMRPAGTGLQMQQQMLPGKHPGP